MKIYSIVEGHGEVQALPVLLRRILHDAAGCFTVQVAVPMRRKQHEFFNEDNVKKAARLALMQPDCAAILLLFDGEDICPKEWGPRVLGWTRSACPTTPCEVVIAYREYETWFLSALESLRNHCGIANHAISPPDPEAKRDAKKMMELNLPPGGSYSPVLHQEKLSAALDMAQCHQRSRSFRKLTKAVGTLLTQMGHPLPAWPPQDW